MIRTIHYLDVPLTIDFEYEAAAASSGDEPARGGCHINEIWIEVETELKNQKSHYLSASINVYYFAAPHIPELEARLFADCERERIEAEADGLRVGRALAP